MFHRYDSSLEDQARQWIEDVTGEKIGTDFHASLRDGVVLCILANAIKPGCIRKINTAGMPFKEMENIKSFLTAARSMGLPEHDCFSTPDLVGAVVLSPLWVPPSTHTLLAHLPFNSMKARIWDKL